MLNKLLLYINTLRYLKFKQIIYRVYYLFRDICSLTRNHYKRTIRTPNSRQVTLIDGIRKSHAFTSPATFRFLNREKTFDQNIDWNFSGYGKLWTYHLASFDFLNQESLSEEEGLKLIRDFIRAEPTLRAAKEAYPVSLRLVNWLKFLYRHDIHDQDIFAFLTAELNTLEDRIEYHLMGNHLFENAVSLTIAGFCLQHNRIFGKGRRLLDDQIQEQILPDGAHYERSPMYHQMLLERVLDTMNFLGQYAGPELQEAAERMISWLKIITFSDGSIPCFNDAVPAMAPSTRALVQYAGRLGIKTSPGKLSESGYRKYHTRQYELVIKGCAAEPSYQPGHSHNDTGSFILYVKGKPLIVDTATSTYEVCPRRQYERSARAHNTTHPVNTEPSEIWESFRIGRREKVGLVDISKTELQLERSLPGSGKHRITRTFSCYDHVIKIDDKINSDSENVIYYAYFHFDPAADAIRVDKNIIDTPYATIRLEHLDKIHQHPCYVADGFNSLVKTNKISISFTRLLETTISIKL